MSCSRARPLPRVVTMLTDRVDAELLDAAGRSSHRRQLRGRAYNADCECERAAYRLEHAGRAHRATAEMTIALMLTLTRRIAEGDRVIRRREPWVWAPTFMLGRGLHGLTLGIVGFGRIGKAVARLAEAHGMRVIHTRETPLDELLAASDVVSLHVPLTPETRHLIGKRELALMKATAYLVNTARGPVVDEAALARALAEGRIAGAALDVFEREPEVTRSCSS
jgi:glyoxylate reductase